MNSENFGLVAYNNDRKSSEIYLKAFNQQFSERTNIRFIKVWDSIDSLISFILKSGVPTVNELSKILVLDEGFKSQVEASNMVDKFISLEQMFKTRGVNRPYLLWATTNDRVYDIFKVHAQDRMYNGQDLFIYEKTLVFNLRRNSNGSVSMNQLENVVTGRADETALSIRHNYKDRGDLLKENFKRTQQDVKNQEMDSINALRQQLKNDAKKNNITNELSREEQRQQQENKYYNAHDRDIPDDPVEQLQARMQQQYGASNDQELEDTLNDDQVQKVFEQSQRTDSYSQEGFLKAYKNMDKPAMNFAAKLDYEQATILFTGRFGSGVTSTIYNVATMYALHKRHVLIVNLDLYDDLISYFPDFIRFYKQKQLSKVFSSHFISVDDVVVDVSSHIGIISDYGRMQREQNVSEKVRSLQRILNFASKNYDIVLVDCGPYFNETYSAANEDINDIVICSTLENLPQLATFSTQKDSLNTNLLDFIVNNHKMPGIIVTQLAFQAHNAEIKKQIQNLDTALSNSRFISAIMYDKNWNLQALSEVPYCLQSPYTFNQIQYITQGLVV